MRISDWSSDVCSSDLSIRSSRFDFFFILYAISCVKISVSPPPTAYSFLAIKATQALIRAILGSPLPAINGSISTKRFGNLTAKKTRKRSEEQKSEIKSLMRITYAVFCLKQNIQTSRKERNAIGYK